MRGFVSVIAFLTAVFAQASASQCHACIQSGSGSDCTGPTIEKPENVTECIWGMENNTVRDSVILTPFRYFLEPGRPNICGSKVFFTAPDFFIGIAYQCCQEDCCNDGIIKGPYDVEEPTVYKCLSCFTENDIDNTTNCIPNKIMNCTGNQVECLSFNGTAARPALPAKYYSFRGCVTKDGCRIGIDNLAGTKPINYTISCSAADQ